MNYQKRTRVVLRIRQEQEIEQSRRGYNDFYRQHIEDIESQNRIAMVDSPFTEMYRVIYDICDAYKFIKNYGILCFLKNMLIHFTRILLAIMCFSSIGFCSMFATQNHTFLIFFSCVCGIISGLMFTEYKIRKLFDTISLIIFFIIIISFSIKLQNN